MKYPIDLVLAACRENLPILDPKIDFADQDHTEYAQRTTRRILSMLECPTEVQRFLRWVPAILITPRAIDVLSVVSVLRKKELVLPKVIEGDENNLRRTIKDMPSPRNQLKVFRRFTFIAQIHRCQLTDLHWWDIDPRGDRFLVGRIKMKDGSIGLIRFKWRSARKHIVISSMGVRKIPVLQEYGNVSFAAELEAAEYDSLKALYEAWLSKDDPIAWLKDSDGYDAAHGTQQKKTLPFLRTSLQKLRSRRKHLMRRFELKSIGLRWLR